GVFHKDQFVQPTIGFTITFPEGWKHRNTAQYLISMHPKKEAIMLLGLAGPAADPEVVGEKFVQKMRTQARVEPTSTRKTSLGEFPAFTVTYLDRSGREPTYLHFAWVSMGTNTYELMALAPDRYRETLRNAAHTLRPITSTERSAVTGKRLRIVSA